MNKKSIIILSCFLFLIGLVVIAAKPLGITQFTSVWIGDATQTADVTPGDNDLYVYGTSEFDGNARFDGNVDLNGNLDVSGTFTNSTTRSFSLPLAGAAVDGGNDVDDASAPDITTCDNIPCIVWADSSEVAAIQYTFRLPPDFSSDMVIYALITSNDASGAATCLDWAVWENGNIDIDAAAIAQSTVCSTSATLDASGDILTLTADATLEAAFTAGRFYTVEFFNASTNDDDLELKGLEVTYTATN